MQGARGRDSIFGLGILEWRSVTVLCGRNSPFLRARDDGIRDSVAMAVGQVVYDQAVGQRSNRVSHRGMP
jgi:hypothetical protein